MTKELLRDILAGTWPLTRQFVGAVIAATGANPAPWEQAYQAAQTATIQRARQRTAARRGRGTPATAYQPLTYRAVVPVPHLREAQPDEPYASADPRSGQHAAPAEVIDIGITRRPRWRPRAS